MGSLRPYSMKMGNMKKKKKNRKNQSSPRKKKKLRKKQEPTLVRAPPLPKLISKQKQ